MSDDQGGDEQPKQEEEQPPQGRWLGAVRSWVGTSVPESEGEEAAAASTPTLSADEIRRRRLERMEGAKTQQQVREVIFSSSTAVYGVYSERTTYMTRKNIIRSTRRVVGKPGGLYTSSIIL